MTDVERAVDSPPSSKTGVVVVHGIGKPDPGDSVESLTGALDTACPDLVLSSHAEQKLLEDYPQPGDETRRLFSVPIRRARIHGEEIVFAEVFWGVQRKASRGFAYVWSLVWGLLVLVLGLTAIIQEAQPPRPQRTPLFSILRTCALCSSATLCGPIYALNISLFLFAICFLALGKGDETSDGPSAVASIFVVGIASIAISVWRLRKRDRLRRRLWYSLLCLGSIWIGLGSGALAFGWLPTTWRDFSEPFISLIVLAFMVASGLLGLTIVMAMSMGVLRPDLRAPTQAVSVSLALQSSLWIFLVPVLWSVVLLIGGDPVQEAYDRVAPFKNVVWVLAAGVFLLATPMLFPAVRQRMPRLILSPYVTLLLLSASFLGAFLYIADGFELSVPFFGSPAAASLRIAIHPVASLIVLVVLWPDVVRNVVDLTEDIITYLRKYGSQHDLIPARPIHSRFRSVVRYALEDESCSRLVFVTHSQGTMVVIDELNDTAEHREVALEELQRQQRQIYQKLEDGKSCLLTMGSPFTHLYQHYFPNLYPSLEDKIFWAKLHRRVSHWLNIYRSDDYVGRQIDGPDLEQIDIGRGGHMEYWVDRRTTERIMQAILSKDDLASGPVTRPESPMASGS